MDLSALVTSAMVALGLAALAGSLAQYMGALTLRPQPMRRIRKGGAVVVHTR